MTSDLRHQAFQVISDIHCKEGSSNQKEQNNKNQSCFVRRDMNYVQRFVGVTTYPYCSCHINYLTTQLTLYCFFMVLFI